MSVDPYLWKYRQRLTIDSTRVVGDYPGLAVLVVWTGNQATSNINQTMIDADGGEAAKSDGGDIRFTSDASGDTELAFDMVKFSTANDPSTVTDVEMWVTVPVSTSADVNFYMWWGNPSATAYSDNDIYGRHAHWGNSWYIVNHGNDFNSVAVSGAHTWTDNNGVSVVEGKVGKAWDFNGVSQYLSGSLTSGNPDFTFGFTMMAWVKYKSFDENWSRVVDLGNGEWVDNIFFGHIDDTADSRCCLVSGDVEFPNDNTDTFTLDRWDMFIMRWNNITGNLELFKNGIPEGETVTLLSAVTNVDRLLSFVGKSNWEADGYLNGSIDELRIGPAAVNDTYVALSYVNQSTPYLFTVGNEVVDISLQTVRVQPSFLNFYGVAPAAVQTSQAISIDFVGVPREGSSPLVVDFTANVTISDVAKDLYSVLGYNWCFEYDTSGSNIWVYTTSPYISYTYFGYYNKTFNVSLSADISAAPPIPVSPPVANFSWVFES